MNKVIKAVVNTVKKVEFKAKKKAPTILIVSGSIGAVAGVVMACVETHKGFSDISEEHKEKVKEIHEKAEEAKESEEKYSEGRALACQYVKTSGKYALLYLPSAIVEILSLTAMVGSNAILRKRATVALGAYVSLKTQFDTLQSRLKETLTPEQYDEIVNGVVTEEVTKTITDENGNDVDVTEKMQKLVNTPVSNSYIIDNKAYPGEDIEGIMFSVKAHLVYANQFITVSEPYRMFLNDVLKELRIPTSKEGQISGWIADKNNTSAYYRPIDFEIRKIEIDGYDRVMVTFPNVVPDIYSDYPEVKEEFKNIE